jgi:hypothetical protein
MPGSIQDKLKEIWYRSLRAIGLGPPAGMAGAMPSITAGGIFDDPAERARLMQMTPEEQTAMLEQALQIAPEYRAQLAEASAVWGTWKQHWVVKQMRQALGEATTKEEMEALINAYRRLL